MIEIQDLSFTYKNEQKPALQEIRLSVPDGGFLGVIGPAGAGKTTLARAVSGMIPHHYTGDFYGSVKVNGLDTVETSLEDISRLVGMVFQDVESQIISPMVEDEILYGLGDPKLTEVARNIARDHHERMDGNGYPAGKKGDEIPLEARIMAVADVYDALVSERVYKKPFSREEALAIMKDGRGTQFDADVLDAFLAVTE